MDVIEFGKDAVPGRIRQLFAQVPGQVESVGVGDFVQNCQVESVIQELGSVVDRYDGMVAQELVTNQAVVDGIVSNSVEAFVNQDSLSNIVSIGQPFVSISYLLGQR